MFAPKIFLLLKINDESSVSSILFIVQLVMRLKNLFALFVPEINLFFISNSQSPNN